MSVLAASPAFSAGGAACQEPPAPTVQWPEGPPPPATLRTLHCGMLVKRGKFIIELHVKKCCQRSNSLELSPGIGDVLLGSGPLGNGSSSAQKGAGASGGDGAAVLRAKARGSAGGLRLGLGRPGGWAERGPQTSVSWTLSSEERGARCLACVCCSSGVCFSLMWNERSGAHASSRRRGSGRRTPAGLRIPRRASPAWEVTGIIGCNQNAKLSRERFPYECEFLHLRLECAL